MKIDVAAGTNYNSVSNLTATSWKFTIAQATPTDPGTPTASAITYGNKLSTSTLSVSGWQWENPNETPTVANTGYKVYYTVSDYTNYNWTNVSDYNSTTHKVVRTIPLTVKQATPSYTTPRGLKQFTVRLWQTSAFRQDGHG